MKEILFAFLLVGFSCFAQETGKRDPQFEVDYEYELVKPGSSIVISTYKSDSEQDKALVLKTSSLDCPGSKGVRIRLVNGDNLIYDQIPIECTAYAPNRPNISARIPITEELERQLEGQEIAEFSLGYNKTLVKFKNPFENLVALLKWVKDERGF